MNYFDYLCLFIIAYFGAFSAIKGFIDEFASIVSLIVAIIFSYYFGAVLKPRIDYYVGIELVSLFLSYGLFFFVFLYLCQRVMQLIFFGFELNRALDLFLGLIFGMLKGFIIITVVIFLLNAIISFDNQPLLLKESSFKLFIDNLINSSELIKKGR